MLSGKPENLALCMPAFSQSLVYANIVAAAQDLLVSTMNYSGRFLNLGSRGNAGTVDSKMITVSFNPRPLFLKA